MTATETRTATATVGFAAAAMLVSYLPFSAVNGALAGIGADERAGTGQLQWVTDAFTVALTAAVLSGGALAERRGRRRVTVGGLALTLLGSGLGWVAGGRTGAGSLHLLWGGQAVAGLGAGLVMSATLSLIAATAPSPAARTRGIAVWAAANVVGLGAGPFLAAAATAVAPGPGGWRWLFPPVALLAALVAAYGLGAAREVASRSATRADLLGQAVGTLGIVALVFGVIRAGGDGVTAPAAVAGLGTGVLVLAGFLLLERRAPAPVLRPALFASPGFSAATLAAATALFTVIGVVFVGGLGFAGQHVGAAGIAVRLGCLFAGNAVASVAAGRLQARVDPRAVLLGALLVAAVGLLTLLLPAAGFAAGLGDLGWRAGADRRRLRRGRRHQHRGRHPVGARRAGRDGGHRQQRRPPARRGARPRRRRGRPERPGRRRRRPRRRHPYLPRRPARRRAGHRHRGGRPVRAARSRPPLIPHPQEPS